VQSSTAAARGAPRHDQRRVVWGWGVYDETTRRGVNTYPACIQGVVSVVDHLHFFVHTVARFRASARYEERVVECYVPMPRQILQ